MNIKGYIYVIEDNDHVRSSLYTLLSRVGYNVHVFDRAERFLLDAQVQSPCVVLAYMRMPSMTGLEMFNRLLKIGSTAPVIFVSGESTPQEIVDALKNGAADFLIKPFPNERLLKAIEKSLQENAKQIEVKNKAVNLQKIVSSLTSREREVCALILKGYDNKDVATFLKVQPDTIKKHRAQIYAKFDVENLAGLLSFAGTDLPNLLNYGKK